MPHLVSGWVCLSTRSGGSWGWMVMVVRSVTTAEKQVNTLRGSHRLVNVWVHTCRGALRDQRDLTCEERAPSWLLWCSTCWCSSSYPVLCCRCLNPVDISQISVRHHFSVILYPYEHLLLARLRCDGCSVAFFSITASQIWSYLPFILYLCSRRQLLTAIVSETDIFPSWGQ